MSRKIIVCVLGILLLLSGIAGTLLPAMAQAAAGNLTGTIEQASRTQITLQTSGHSVVLEITNATIIHIGDKTTGPGDLRPGMAALVITTDGKTATEIRAYTRTTTTSQPAPSTLTGVILEIGAERLSLKAADHTLPISLTAGTVYKLDGKVVGKGDIRPGMSAAILTTDGKTAVEVRAYSAHNTTSTKPATEPAPTAHGQTGIITLIADGQISLQAASHTFVYPFNSTTLFKLDGKAVGLGDLKAGMSAIIFATEGRATEVRAYSHTTTTTKPATEPASQPSSGQTGIITQLRGDGISFKSGDHMFSYGVPPATPVKLDGNPVKLADLKLGMSVLVFSLDGKVASEVRAYSPHTTEPATQPTTQPAQPPAPNGQTGSIAQVEGGQITLKASVHTLIYTLTDGTLIKLDGKVVGPGELKSSLMAIVFSPDGKIATEVRAYTPPK